MSTASSRTDTPTTAISTPPRPRVTDAVALGVLALLVRLPAFFSTRHLTFDDGVFASSALAMRDGGLPFRDIFSSQGPWFLPLVRVGDVIGFQSINSPRVIAVISGITAVLAIYWTALALTDRVGALLAGALAATSGGLAWVTGPLAADGPALAFAAIAVGLALHQRNRPRDSTALGLGVAVGLTLSTKSLEAPVLVPVALVLAAPVLSAARSGSIHARGLRHGALAVGASIAVFLVVTVPLGFAEVWDQAVRYRTEAASERDIPGTTAKLFSTLWDRDLALLFFALVALVSGVIAFRRRGSARVAAPDDDASWWSLQRLRTDEPVRVWLPSGRLLAVSWLATTIVWLSVVVSPLFRPHVAAVALPLVLVIGIYRPQMRVLAVAALAAVPMVVVQLDGLLVPAPYRGLDAELVEAMRELPEGAWVISDEPGVVWRAGLRTTDDLVDPSMLRLEQGRYDEASVARQASDPRVCAVVMSSDQHFRLLTGLPDRLAGSGFSPRADIGDGTVLYVRDDCDPTAG